jgi:hypothetical protein
MLCFYPLLSLFFNLLCSVSVSTILAVNRYFAQLLEAEDAAYELVSEFKLISAF